MALRISGFGGGVDCAVERTGMPAKKAAAITKLYRLRWLSVFMSLLVMYSAKNNYRGSIAEPETGEQLRL